MWKKVAPQVPETEQGARDEFTSDEFEAWWNLTGSGRDGKTGKGKSSYDWKNPLWTDSDTDKILDIITTAAKNSDIRPAAAKKFLSQFGADAKSSIAEREDLPLVFVVTLSKDSSAFVRERIAGRKDTPAVVLAMMAETETKEAPALALAKNLHTPAASLGHMFDNREKYVTKRNNSYQVRKEPVTEYLLENPNLPARCAAEGLQSVSFPLYCAALKHPSVPSEFLVAQWEKPSIPDYPYRITPTLHLTIHKSVIQNPNCPENILQEAINGNRAYSLSGALWRNTNLPEHIAWRAIEQETVGWTEKPYPSTCSIINENDNIPYGIVKKLYEKKVVPYFLIEDWEKRVKAGEGKAL